MVPQMRDCRGPQPYNYVSKVGKLPDDMFVFELCKALFLTLRPACLLQLHENSSNKY